MLKKIKPNFVKKYRTKKKEWQTTSLEPDTTLTKTDDNTNFDVQKFK